MAKKKNTLLRLAVPLIGIPVIIGVGIAVSVTTSGQAAKSRSSGAPATTPEQGEPVAQGDASLPDQPPETAPDTEPIAQAQDPAVAAGPAPESPDRTGLRARVFGDQIDGFDRVGSVDAGGAHEIELEFTPFGAGVAALRLAHEFVTVEQTDHYKLQSARRGNNTVAVDPDALEDAIALITRVGDAPASDASARDEALTAAAASLSNAGLGDYTPELALVTTPESAAELARRVRTWVNQYVVPFALLAVEIDGQRIDLSNVGGAGGAPRGVWRQAAPGSFEAVIENERGETIATVLRRFTVDEGSHDVILQQSVVNPTGAPMTVGFVQTGPIDPPKPRSTYGGDKRRFRFGYLLKPEAQLGDPFVTADRQLIHHHEVLGSKSEQLVNASGVSSKAYTQSKAMWPNAKADKKGWRLVWAGLTDRYYAVAMHPIVDPDALLAPEDKLFSGITGIDRLVLNPAAPGVQDATVVLSLQTAPVVAPAASSETAPGVADASYGFYAGPMSKPIVAAEPMPVALGIEHVIVYNFGSCTSFCTFGWLTHILLDVLRFNHWATADWALAIIILVIFVRTALHPVTRWSQIRMQRFGVQMQAMAPKQQKLKEKYKDDPKKLQAETAKLWREEGISPAGFLGCLPMFLQSPVWIALYATLFFATELRHEPGFYGVFQSFSGGNWRFLADLSAPDAALPLGPLAFTPPLIGNWVGRIDTINLLPILMGFVFFAHQKYLTPPTSATMTPEQQSQTRMIRLMSVVMFPLIMYPAPSGLSIYFVTNSTIAIFENRWIRAHMNKHGMLDAEKIKANKKTKRPGFLSRLQRVAEAQQKARAAAENQGRGYGTGKGGRQVQASKPAKKTINRQYKKKK